jgi:chemotaxis protein histidine kinase CheA
MSGNYKKEVRFVSDNFRGESIPFEYRLIVKDILIQLVRNSLKHGIEMPEERERNGKIRCGSIEIATDSNNGLFSFRFRDDGRGLQIEKLKERILLSEKWSQSEVKKWDEKKIAQTIFESGISTSDSTDLVAGRGIGMSIIYQKIKNHQGKIDFDYQKGQYLEFVISLPKSTKKKDKKITKGVNV